MRFKHAILLAVAFLTACNSKQTSLLKIEHEQKVIDQKIQDLRVEYGKDQAAVNVIQARYPDAVTAVNEANAQWKKIGDDLTKKLDDIYSKRGTTRDKVNAELTPLTKHMQEFQQQADALGAQRANLQKEFDREKEKVCGKNSDLDLGTMKCKPAMLPAGTSKDVF